jgi:hypothetical protein
MYLTYNSEDVEYFGVSEISIFKGKYRFNDEEVVPLFVLNRIGNLKLLVGR